MNAREKNTNLFVFDERRTEKETNIMAKVGIVMGSDSDMPVMAKAADILEKLGIDYEMTIISAHREPDVFFEYAKSAESKGFKVIIAGAGMAAHLPGMCAVTAGCANVDAIGSFIIGAVAGVLVCVAVYFIEDKLKVDDPVGAVAVHGCNGIWGTIAVGLFDYKDGLFYGGGVHHLLIQLLGIVCIAGWTIVTMTIVFTVLKKTIGLRVSAQEEVEGLDSTEHGLESGYPDFVPRELH